MTVGRASGEELPTPTPAVAGSAPAPPGPADRVAFFDEQRRHRLASRRSALLAVVAVAVSGIPLYLFVAPALFAVALVALYALDLVAPVDPSVWRAVREVVFILPTLWSALRGGGGAEVPWATLAAVTLLPGAVAMLAAWVGLRLLFRRAGVGGILRRLRARAPDPRRLEERRLVNVVHETAVAAGVRPPAVMLVDSAAANAAAIGLTTDDATIVVSRGLVERLDREQAQALIAHLVASVGNGDLRIAALILSVFQTWGLLALLFDAPYSHRARRALRRLVAAARRAGRGALDTREAEVVTGLLLEGAAMEEDGPDLSPDLGIIIGHSLPYNLLVDLPALVFFGVASIGSKLAIWMFTLLVFGPVIAALWRARRRLADAGAVQLTRNPDALSGALRDLAAREVEIAGAAPVNFLFPVWSRSADSATDRTDVASLVLGLHLDPAERLERIQALGARLGAAGADLPATPPGIRDQSLRVTARELAGLLFWLGIALLMLVVAIALNFATAAAIVLAVSWLLGLVFVGIPGWIGRAAS